MTFAEVGLTETKETDHHVITQNPCNRSFTCVYEQHWRMACLKEMFAVFPVCAGVKGLDTSQTHCQWEDIELLSASVWFSSDS